MPHDFTPHGAGKLIGKNNSQYRILEEKLDADGSVRSRLLTRNSSGSTYRPQTKINAFNFPFTGNSGGGCFFQCVYCFLRQPFFQMHRTLPHGREMDVAENFAEGTRDFLLKNDYLPQYMKRVQWGVATEMWHPKTVHLGKPYEALRHFQKHGQSWMLHMVTKSPAILDWADLLAEMKHQVQVEVSFVTLNEDHSRIFERGTPSVAQRLRIVEELAKRGVFVRMMMMPCLREYELEVVDGSRYIVFQNSKTGAKRPGAKRVTERDGNAEGDKVGLELFEAGKMKKLSLEESADWKPVIAKDWSELDRAQAEWRNRGAKAYKQKDMNYFYVDELIRAHQADEAPKPERGRLEDPTAECLIHSGESVRDAQGQIQTVEVSGYHVPKKKREGLGVPKVTRSVMDFGYRLHSTIDWKDCI